MSTSDKEIQILYIDDELSNVIGFKASFRTRYNITSVVNVQAAMEALKSNEFHIIIADQRMPEMSGVEFFESIMEEYPYPIRILMTGYSDINETIEAINKTHIFSYISKPWREDEIYSALNSAFEYYSQRKELSLRNTQLDKAYQELNRFVYSASHDMRSPLMSILGIVKVARLDKLPAEVMSYFEMIESSVIQLSVFNSNLIDYYTNTKNSAVFEKCDVAGLVKELISYFNFFPGSDFHSFRVNIDEATPLHTDYFILRTVLSNLISNSVKFRDPNKTESFSDISVVVTPQKATIVVTDNGIGIEQKYQAEIFTMFFRATRKNSGSGIGLYIVQEALEKIKGNVSMKDNPDGGCIFTVEIPNTLPI